MKNHLRKIAAILVTVSALAGSTSSGGTDATIRFVNLVKTGHVT